MESTTITQGIHLYEKIASDIALMIERGTFRPGERIPSVRQLSMQHGVSITTVLQAYRLLEDRGLVVANPQSGYYVRFRLHDLLPEPEISSPAPDPAQVSVDRLVMMVLNDSANPDLVKFSAAIPDPDLLPTTRLNNILASIARRGDPRQNLCAIPQGCDELRVQIAQKMFHAGCNISQNEVIITSGCMEAVNLSLRAVCKPGDTVAIESPSYFGILQMLEVLGLKALEIPTHPQTGISLEALHFAIEHQRVHACVLMPNISNPLGSCMPDENKKELVELLSKYAIPLIEDDLHGELFFSEQRPKAAKSYDRQGLVLYCSSFSKDLSPSSRVGWVAPGRYKEQVERLKMTTNMGTSILPQLAIAQFLESGGYDHLLRRVRRAYAQKVVSMSQAVMRYFPGDTRVTRPSGGFVLWVQLAETVDSLELYKRALKVGITLAPGHIFSASQKYRNFIRLNAAYYSEKTDWAVKRLGELIAVK